MSAQCGAQHLEPASKPAIPASAYLVRMAGVNARYELIRPKTGEPALIMLVFQWNRKRVRVSTREYVYPEHWSKKRSRVADKWSHVEPDYLEVNRLLDSLDQLVRHHYNAHRRALTLDELTPDVLKDIIETRLLGAPKVKNEPTILDYYTEYLHNRINSGNLGDATIKGEQSTYNHFATFNGQQSKPLVFAQANLKMFEQIRDYLWGQGMSADSSVHKNLRRFRQMLLHAEANGKETGGSIKAISLKSQLGLSSKAMDTIALSEADLKILADLPLRGKDHLARVRDLFLCGCYTGLRVNKWGDINRESVIDSEGVKMLQFFTTKGRRKSITIPLHPVLFEIFEKHDWQMPKVPTQAKINKYLKSLCQTAGFTDEIELARNVRGKSVLQTFERWQLVTSHTARRSFATNAHAAGLPIDDIQALTGHADRKTLEHYIKEDGKHRARRLSKSDWFTKKT